VVIMDKMLQVLSRKSTACKALHRCGECARVHWYTESKQSGRGGESTGSAVRPCRRRGSRPEQRRPAAAAPGTASRGARDGGSIVLARGGCPRSLTSPRMCGGDVAVCSIPLPHDTGTGMTLRDSRHANPYAFQKLVGAPPRPARPEGLCFRREILPVSPVLCPQALSRAPRPRGADDRLTDALLEVTA